MSATLKPAPVLTGVPLLLAGMVLALTNFMVVLDTTIANVATPHIAGSLGISSSQGVWIITSYAVAEAIVVPLTGWLAGRFGAVRVFTVGVIGFGLFSVMVGLSTSLSMIVVARVGQGLFGGPLMPLSQTLLLRIFPKEEQNQAMGLWAMTTVVAPVLGPILGGTISDNWSWNWSFFINIPVAAIAAFGVIRLLTAQETPKHQARVDGIGLALLVIWVGALQLMLDLGQEHDWFGDSFIVTLAAIAGVGFLVFLAWEVTERQPIVDLRVFRHRGFAVAVASLCFAFATFFASMVLIPQWLQASLGYTATYAGYVTAFSGVAAVIMAPVAAKLSSKVDPRLLVSGGILWFAMTSLLRVQWTSGTGFWTLAIPQLLQGFGMPFFFVPLTIVALGAVDPEETASAAGVMNFLRTMAGAVGTSLSTTWANDSARSFRSELIGKLNTGPVAEAMEAAGFSLGQIRQAVERVVEQEAMALAMNQTFLLSAIIFGGAAMVIWLSPRPSGEVDTSAAH